jgi:hypothetical protein
MPIIIPLRKWQTDLYAADPVSWVHDKLGEHLWSKQRVILESVRDHRRTAVHSCHGSGKSYLAARITAWWIETHPPGSAFVVTSAPTGRQVRAILWREIGRTHAKGGLLGRMNQTEWWVEMPEGNEEMVAFGQKPSDMDPAAFQGIHAQFVLVIFDESAGIPKPLWEAADTLLSNDDSRFLAIGNPDDPVSEFAEVCKPGSGWNVIGVDGLETPNFTGEVVPDKLRKLLIGPTWVEEKRRKWGETNPLYIAKVRGQFPEISKDGLIPVSWVRAAQMRELPQIAPIELGVDVGGGGDKSVIAVRRGGHVRILSRDQNPDTMQTTGHVVQAIQSTKAVCAKVDTIGIGRGVVDRLKEQGHPAIGVNVGSAPQDKEAFLNLRAEGYWGLRERFQDGNIDIDQDDEDLAAQLVDLKFKATSAGKVQIESKEDIKRRGKSSPDDADAVMLSFINVEDDLDGLGLTW